MSKKMIIDGSNFPIGFYETDLHAPEVIPAGAIDITEAQWTELVDYPGERVWNTGTLSVDVYTPPFDLTASQDVAKTGIKNDFESEMVLGYICPVNSIKMDTTQPDIDLLQAGYDLATSLSETTMDIRDFTNIVQTGITLANINSMIIELKTNYRTQLTKKWTLQSSIDDAINQAGIDAIVW